ncbi:MAG: tol-pal system protein YbgF [Burkholderiales bacterium]
MSAASHPMRRFGSYLVLISAFAAAPAGAALFGDDVARRGVLEQQKRIDGLTARYDELAARFSKLEESVKANATAATQPVLDLANQLQAMRDELRSVRGQLEVLSNTIEANAKRQRDMYVDLDTRVRRFEQAAPPAGAAPGAAGPSPAAGAAAATASTAATGAAVTEDGRVYEAAQAHRRNGAYQAAIAAFQSFVAQYPRSPLAHRAQYWIGDSYYNLRDFKNAIATQQKLISTYPDSASVPDALLNIASSQIEIGDNSAARKTMDSLVARYPTSEAAEKARRRLASLR